MYPVVKQIIRSFTVLTALFLTLITRVRGGQTCGPEELVQCAKPLSILTDSGLTFVSDKGDLDKICPDMKEALKCIHAYTRLCMNLSHRRHFRKLFHGTTSMVHEICDNHTYQQEFLKYVPCMKEAQSEHDACFNRYSLSMRDIQANTNTQVQKNHSNTDEISYQKKKREAADEGIRSVCCSFQEYVECSTYTTRRTCGDDAADFSRSFMDRMSSSMIKLHCTEYGMEQCGLTSAAQLPKTLLLPLVTLSVLLLR